MTGILKAFRKPKPKPPEDKENRNVTDALRQGAISLLRQASRGDEVAIRKFHNEYHAKNLVAPAEFKKFVEDLVENALDGNKELENNAGAKYVHSYCLEYGIGVKKNIPEHITVCKAAAYAGHPTAMWEYAMLLKHGVHQVLEKNEVAAAQLFKEAADAGHPKAKMSYAHCLEKGEGVEKNIGDALRLYREAEAAGEGGAKLAEHNLLTNIGKQFGVIYADKSAVGALTMRLINDKFPINQGIPIGRNDIRLLDIANLWGDETLKAFIIGKQRQEAGGVAVERKVEENKSPGELIAISQTQFEEVMNVWKDSGLQNPWLKEESLKLQLNRREKNREHKEAKEGVQSDNRVVNVPRAAYQELARAWEEHGAREVAQADKYIKALPGYVEALEKMGLSPAALQRPASHAAAAVVDKAKKEVAL